MHVSSYSYLLGRAKGDDGFRAAWGLEKEKEEEEDSQGCERSAMEKEAPWVGTLWKGGRMDVMSCMQQRAIYLPLLPPLSRTRYE
jgi:hypothetical protein